jgi:hypothetical protein
LAANGEVARLAAELSEARERQAATAEVLSLIADAPTDLFPVFERIVRNAARLKGLSRPDRQRHSRAPIQRSSGDALASLFRGAVAGGLSGQALRLEPLPIVISGLLRFLIFRRFGLRRLECLVGLQHRATRGFFLKHLFSYLECRCPAFRLIVVAACVPA